MPPVGSPDDGASVRDAAAEDDLGAGFEGGGNTEAAKVGLCGYGRMGLGPGCKRLGGIDILEVRFARL